VWDERLDAIAAVDRLAVDGPLRASAAPDGSPLLDSAPAPRCVIKSPGMGRALPILARARERGLPVLDELELGWRLDRRPLVAVTGTNGKSTTAALLSAVLKRNDLQADVAGNTTFGPPLSALKRRQAGVVVCEVSSYQLEFCPAVLASAAVFTNLTCEHLERHRTMARYAACKRRLFVRGKRGVPVAAVNVEDPFGRCLAAEIAGRGGRVIRYGNSRDADYRIRDVEWDLDRSRMTIDTPQGALDLATRLPGAHNARNAAGVLALAAGLELDLARSIAALSAAAAPPGRLERVAGPDPFDVIVDFAHTPDGVAQALGALRRVVERRRGARLIVVVSAMTYTTRAQRRRLGRVAATRSDRLILTCARWTLRDAAGRLPDGLEAGARRGDRRCVEVCVERPAAIERALGLARPGDVVAVLGCGNMRGPIFDAQDRSMTWDDRDGTRALLGATMGGR
jgi:UDP-N-acetylmuramoyl-L-alanyl-D-glutamate--2,6-diaminopimelate ligase